MRLLERRKITLKGDNRRNPTLDHIHHLRSFSASSVEEHTSRRIVSSLQVTQVAVQVVGSAICVTSQGILLIGVLIEDG